MSAFALRPRAIRLASSTSGEAAHLSRADLRRVLITVGCRARLLLHLGCFALGCADAAAGRFCRSSEGREAGLD